MSPDPSEAAGYAKHSPARLSTYREIHESRMDGFATSGFVGEHNLGFEFEGSGVLVIEGEISCLGDIVIRVEKYLDVLEEDTPDPLVRTYSYSYNQTSTSVNWQGGGIVDSYMVVPGLGRIVLWSVAISCGGYYSVY